MYGPAPPEAVAVVEPVVIVADAPVTSSACAERETDGVLTRDTVTDTVVVAVCPYASVAVTKATPLSVWPGDRPDPVKLVVADVGELIAIPAPPDCHDHWYVYDPEPPEADATTEPVVSDADAPVVDTLVGDVDTATPETRCIDTDTVVVAVWPYASVAVTRATPEKVCPAMSPEAEKEVVAEDGEPIVMPAPPDCHDQEYEYGPVPPDAVAVVDPVDSELDAPTAESDAGETETDGRVTRERLADTVAVPTSPIVSLTVTSATPVTVCPGWRLVVENDVVADVGEPMPMPAPPDCHDHWYE